MWRTGFKTKSKYGETIEHFWKLIFMLTKISFCEPTGQVYPARNNVSTTPNFCMHAVFGDHAYYNCTNVNVSLAFLVLFLHVLLPLNLWMSLFYKSLLFCLIYAYDFSNWFFVKLEGVLGYELVDYKWGRWVWIFEGWVKDGCNTGERYTTPPSQRPTDQTTPYKMQILYL